MDEKMDENFQINDNVLHRDVKRESSKSNLGKKKETGVGKEKAGQPKPKEKEMVLLQPEQGTS